MARIRTIKPQHVNDKELSNISLQAHLLWILSWCFSDDEGVLENDPLLLKSLIFPRRHDIRVEQISQWLDQLVKARYIIPFTHGGASYYIHRTFKTHQKIDRPQASKIPKEIIQRTLAESSTNVRPSRVEESNGEESKPPPRNEITYDVEKSMSESAALFEQILMKTGHELSTGETALRKYHLHLVEKEKYPMGKKAAFAGFEKWMWNEKKNENGTDTRNGKKEMQI